MYSSESFSEVELEEIKSLADLFSDLETGVIRQTYLACDKDVKWARERLAEIAKHPSVQSQFMTTLPVSTGSQSLGRAPSGMHSPEEHSQLNGAMGAGAAATGLAALALAPAPSDAPSNSAYLPAFDVNTLTETLTQVGASVTDGITSFASNITGWVADLASAFDAGWGDEGDERIAHVSDKNEPSVGYGTGLGIDRPYQRRLGSANSGAVTSNNGAATANRSHDQDLEGEEEGWEDEVDGYGKDD